MELQQEMQNVSAAFASLSLLYFLMPRLRRGFPRLFCVLSCLPILATVPFSTRSLALRAVFAYLLLWITPSKLLLRCWDVFPDYPSDGFVYFIATSVAPLRVKGRTQPRVNGPKPTSATTLQGALFISLLQFLLFLATLSALLHPNISSWLTYALYGLILYLGMEGGFGLFSCFISSLLGLELHPLFDKPILACSVSEFWGRRWNRLAGYILRHTVYVPMLHLLSQKRLEHGTSIDSSNGEPANGSPTTCMSQGVDVGMHFTAGKKDGTDERGGLQVDGSCKEFQNVGGAPVLARAVAMLASFTVSGLIHEWIFYCITQTHPTWEVTMFFIIHGVVSVSEVLLRRKFRSRRILPQPVAIVFTLAFVYFSAAWLFVPPLIRVSVGLHISDDFKHMQNVVMDLLSSW